jgi:hypothetical protein
VAREGGGSKDRGKRGGEPIARTYFCACQRASTVSRTSLKEGRIVEYPKCCSFVILSYDVTIQDAVSYTYTMLLFLCMMHDS